MKGKIWLKNQKRKADAVGIPDALLNLVKKVKSNAAIESSDSD